MLNLPFRSKGGIEPAHARGEGIGRRHLAGVDVKNAAIGGIEPQLEEGVRMCRFGAGPVVGRQEAKAQQRHAPEEAGADREAGKTEASSHGKRLYLLESRDRVGEREPTPIIDRRVPSQSLECYLADTSQCLRDFIHGPELWRHGISSAEALTYEAIHKLAGI